MAGIWKLWKHPQTGQWESTFAVLTGEPNEVMQPIHDRLTTVLEPRDYAEYLAFSDRRPIHLLRVLSSDELRATRLEKPRAKAEVKVKGRPSDLSFRFGVITDAKTQSGLSHVSQIVNTKLEVFSGSSRRSRSGQERQRRVDDWLSGGR